MANQVSDKPLLDIGIGGRQLSYERTIPKSLVHKRSVGEVLITDYQEMNSTTIVAAVRVPQTHAFYNYQHKLFIDDIFFLEAVRQCALFAPCQLYGVPADFQAVVTSFNTELIDIESHQLNAVPPRCICLFETREATDGQAKFFGDASIFLDGVLARKVGGIFQFLPAERYELMRAKVPNRTLSIESEAYHGGMLPEPHLIGRSDQHHTALTSPQQEDTDTFKAQLNIDWRNPFYFDHELDHAPGILLIEAARQMSLYIASQKLQLSANNAIMKKMNANFSAFIELGEPTEAVGTFSDASEEPNVSEVQLSIRFEQKNRSATDISYIFAYT